eukprot:PITA_28396
MKQLKEGKASGPNGFSTTFFHSFWDLIKEEVWQVVEESGSLHWLLPSLNSTFIALFRKEERTITPTKFRPIALCNIIYKVISKVIANRLMPLLPLLISPEQSGYIEGRQILDGIILTHEIIHSLKISKQAGMILKIDLSKAFDKLSWTYIQKMLCSFGFSPMWVRWIQSLISSTFFSILVNGIPSQPFSPSRGIRQGDPLSPFLFVLMAEGLGRHIKHALLSQHLKGISIHNSPATTHQQFIDDNMLFGYPYVQEATTFKALLKDFSDASGTSINKAKSQIFFFHTPPITQHAIARILGVSIASLPSNYLGAPLIDSTIKHASWRRLLEKLESHLSIWTLRALNIASRLVLIKAVLQAMPLYLFSILAAPKWVLKKSRDLQRNFMWGAHGTNRKWALIKWTTACKPKEKEGIGLQDWEEKQKETVKQQWTQEIEQGYRQWKQSDKLIRNVDNHTKEILERELQKRQIRYSEGKDILRWGYTPRGSFTMKEAYQIKSQDSVPQDPIWGRIWTPGIWPKVSSFLWLFGHHKILTWDNLRKRNIHGPSICPNCQSQEEMLQHLLDSCPLANHLWEKTGFRCQRKCRTSKDIINSMRLWHLSPYKSTLLNHLWRIIPGLLLWTIWKERNKRIFKDQSTPLEIIWGNFCHNLQETLSLKTWVADDFPMQANEIAIWENWNIQLPHGSPACKPSDSSNISKHSWLPPPRHRFKLNFDGASKGNPGKAGFGGIFRDHKGSPLLIYLGNIGWDTNNSAELEGL